MNDAILSIIIYFVLAIILYGAVEAIIKWG